MTRSQRNFSVSRMAIASEPERGAGPATGGEAPQQQLSELAEQASVLLGKRCKVWEHIRVANFIMIPHDRGAGCLPLLSASLTALGLLSRAAPLRRSKSRMAVCWWGTLPALTNRATSS
jgi:hypothetical protein